MRSLVPMLAAVSGLAGLAATAVAQGPTCNLGCTPCSGVPACLGACPTSVPVVHAASDPCGLGGSFDLGGTAFDGSGPAPPLRFWAYDRYASANSGCNDPNALGWLSHAGASRWLLDADWSAALSDGCIDATLAPRRAVAELSFADAAREGSIDHRAFYLAASVDELGGAYDFDRITGGDGCNDRDVVVHEVPRPTFPPNPPSMQCTGNPTWVAGSLEASNAVDCDYRDVGVEIADEPTWRTETGSGAAPALIQGVEFLYQFSPIEPLSSDACTAGWLPARDPAMPSLALGPLPRGIRRALIAIPNSYDPAWIAARIIYADASVNPMGSYDPLGGAPALVSPPGGHCGPVAMLVLLDLPLLLQKWSSLPTTATAAVGDPLTYRFSASNFQDPTAGHDAVLEDVLPPCLDLSGFDPIAFPSQISSPTMPLVVEWTAATRTLRLHFQAVVQPGDQHFITVTGIRAGVVGDCVNEATLASTRCRRTTSGATDTVRIDVVSSCPVLPVPVSGVRAVRAGGGVDLSWTTSPDVATVRYNVWSIEDAKASLPLLNQVAPTRRSVCADVPRGSETCVDARPLAAGSVRYYQVRGVCGDGREGTEHP